MKIYTLLLLCPLAGTLASGQTNAKHIVTSASQFNGYTNYWHDVIRDSIVQYDVKNMTDVTDLKMEADIRFSTKKTVWALQAFS